MQVHNDELCRAGGDCPGLFKCFSGTQTPAYAPYCSWRMSRPNVAPEGKMNPFDVKSVLLAKHAQHVVIVHFPIALSLMSWFFDLAGAMATQSSTGGGGLLQPRLGSDQLAGRRRHRYRGVATATWRRPIERKPAAALGLRRRVRRDALDTVGDQGAASAHRTTAWQIVFRVGRADGGGDCIDGAPGRFFERGQRGGCLSVQPCSQWRQVRR